MRSRLWGLGQVCGAGPIVYQGSGYGEVAWDLGGFFTPVVERGLAGEHRWHSQPLLTQLRFR